MTQKLHFHVDKGINTLIRDAYWFENRQEFANNVLDCFMGITIEQKRAVIQCKLRLVPTIDKKKMTLVDELDSNICELKKRYKMSLYFKQPKKKITHHTGWLMINGDFYPCGLAGHVDKSADVYDRENMINIKDEYLNMHDLYSDNSERWLEEKNAIKITEHKLLFGGDRIITQEQLDRLSDYLEEGNKVMLRNIEFVYKKQMVKALREYLAMYRRRQKIGM